MPLATETLSEQELVWEYSQWSEEHWCAGFLDPSPRTVQEFFDHINFPERRKCCTYRERGNGELRDYEKDMIEKVRDLERKHNEAILQEQDPLG